jgi:Dam-replacing family
MDQRLPTKGLQSYSASQHAFPVKLGRTRTLLVRVARPTPSTRFPATRPSSISVVLDCESGFQLKSAASALRARLTDGAYAQMRSAILQGRAPNLFLLHYQFNPFTVASLIFIPNFAFTLAALECRPPLAVTARRAGWVGCNILLNQIPADARILLVKDNRSIPAIEARRAFRKLKPLPAQS